MAPRAHKMGSMTETTLKIQLKEFAAVRVVCRKNDCGGIIELPVDRLSNLAKGNFTKCPLCKEDIVPPVQFDPLVELGLLIQRLNDLEPSFSLEFPVRIQDDAQRHGK